MPNFEDLGFKGHPSFFGLKLFASNSDLETEILTFANPLSWIGVENKHFCLTKESPTLKPSSLKSYTCQDWIYFTLANQILFQTGVSNMCGLHMNMNCLVLFFLVYHWGVEHRTLLRSIWSSIIPLLKI